KMMSEEWMWLSIVGHRIAGWRKRLSIFVQGIGCAGLAVILLHVAALAVTLEFRLEVAVARTLRVGAVGPLCIGALDGEATLPMSERILDGQSVGYVVAGSAHFRADEHRLMEAFVLGRIKLLIRNLFLEDSAGVFVFL